MLRTRLTFRDLPPAGLALTRPDQSLAMSRWYILGWATAAAGARKAAEEGVLRPCRGSAGSICPAKMRSLLLKPPAVMACRCSCSLLGLARTPRPSSTLSASVRCSVTALLSVSWLMEEFSSSSHCGCVSACLGSRRGGDPTLPAATGGDGMPSPVPAAAGTACAGR